MNQCAAPDQHEYCRHILKYLMEKQDQQQPQTAHPGSNADKQGVDKEPGEEKGKAEKVTPEDLKGKKVDADPAEEKRGK
jgi:hypothetical protein